MSKTESPRSAVHDGASPYLTVTPDPQARLRLFCFHESGGTASEFVKWPGAFGPDVTAIPVELPGHGSRMQETLITDLDELLGELNEHLGPELTGPHAFYGHCTGGLLAHAFTQYRMRNDERLPECLLIGACPPPRLFLPQADELLDLPDDDLTEFLMDLGIIPPQIAGMSQWRDRITEVARCDGNLIVRYRCAEDEPLPCPIHAFVGDVDTYVPFHDVEGWKTYTTAEFTVHTVPGGHLFYLSRPEELMSELTCRLERCVRKL